MVALKGYLIPLLRQLLRDIAGVAELAYAADLKSAVFQRHAGSNPAPGTMNTDLKSRGPKGPCGFDPRPRYHPELAGPAFRSNMPDIQYRK
jgi:hypothetical protein